MGYRETFFESEESARAEAERINRVIQPRPENARELLEVLSKTITKECVHCGEYGVGGMRMNCGFEVVEPHCLDGEWRLLRVRCMLRSWIDAETRGCNPLESELGTAEEWKTPRSAYVKFAGGACAGEAVRQ